jgi:predicted lysophospholipase L1 biosynthesis ABC-type transport system permease subunit
VNQQWHPNPEPIKTNDPAAIAVGTAVWAVALVVLLIFRPAPEHTWWIWTCATGVGFGLFGIWFVRRPRRG